MKNIFTVVGNTKIDMCGEFSLLICQYISSIDDMLNWLEKQGITKLLIHKYSYLLNTGYGDLENSKKIFEEFEKYVKHFIEQCIVLIHSHHSSYFNNYFKCLPKSILIDHVTSLYRGIPVDYRNIVFRYSCPEEVIKDPEVFKSFNFKIATLLCSDRDNIAVTKDMF